MNILKYELLKNVENDNVISICKCPKCYIFFQVHKFISDNNMCKDCMIDKLKKQPRGNK